MTFPDSIHKRQSLATIATVTTLLSRRTNSSCCKGPLYKGIFGFNLRTEKSHWHDLPILNKELTYRLHFSTFVPQCSAYPKIVFKSKFNLQNLFSIKLQLNCLTHKFLGSLCQACFYYLLLLMEMSESHYFEHVDIGKQTLLSYKWDEVCCLNYKYHLIYRNTVKYQK